MFNKSYFNRWKLLENHITIFDNVVRSKKLGTGVAFKTLKVNFMLPVYKNNLMDMPNWYLIRVNRINGDWT